MAAPIVDGPHDRAMEPVRFRVRGRVTDASGAPVRGCIIDVVDRDMRGSQPLGRTIADDAGGYAIAYTAAQFSRAEKATADVQVTVSSKAGTVLTTSDIRFNAAIDQVIDLVVPAPDTSEYEQVLAECAQVAGAVAAVDLTDDDIAFLAGDTGRPASLWRAFVSANRLGQRSGLPVEFWYALVRVGLVSDEAGLSRLPWSAVQAAVSDACERNIVPAALLKELDGLAAKIRSHAVSTLAADKGAVASVVAAAVTDPSARQKAIGIWYDTGGDPKALSAILDKQLDPASAAQVRAGIALTHIVGAQPALLSTTLDRLRGSAVEPSAVAKFTAGQWRDLVKQSGTAVPTGVAALATEDVDAVTVYGSMLERSAAAAYPQVALISRLPGSTVPGAAQIAAYLDSRPDLDLGTLSPGQLAEDLGPDRADLAKQISTLSRVYRVSSVSTHVEAMLAAGYDSAYSIARGTVDAFVDRVGGTVTKTDAVGLFRKAMTRYTLSLGVLNRYRVDLNGIGPRAVPASATGPVPPDWAHLFGSLDFCDCPDCRAVDGPAAYLVDLLHFLAERGEPGRTNPLDVLLGRRPDLATVKLTCANTNTHLPTIDIVNELCEHRITHTAAPTASSLTEDQLAVAPEWVDNAAYETLTTRRYPLVLPLDRPWEELRAHLDAAGVPRWRLINQVRGAAAATQAAVERLGLSPVEHDLVTGAAVGADGAAAAGLWGQRAGWITSSMPATTVLAAARITVDDLAELIATRFAQHADHPELHREGCTLDQVRVTGLSDALMTRLHGFLRLRRATGWSTSQLDAVIAAVGGFDLDDTALRAFADVAILAQRLNTEPAVLARWWMPALTPPGATVDPAPVEFARALDTTPAAVTVFAKLTGLPPLTSPAATRAFVDAYDEAASWPMGIADVAQTLTSAWTGALATAEAQTPVLADLRQALDGVIETTSDTRETLSARRAAALAAHLAAPLGVSEPVAAALLAGLRTAEGSILELLTAKAFRIGAADARYGRCLVLLAKAARSVVVFGLSADDVPLLCGSGPAAWAHYGDLPVPAAAGGPNPAVAPTWRSFALLATFLTRRAAREATPGAWTAFLTSAAAASAVPATLVQAAATLLRPGTADMASLAAAAGYDLDAWRDGRALLGLDTTLHTLATIGATAADGLAWTERDVTVGAARSAVAALRARTPADKWTTVEAPLRNKLRERQRDALVAALTVDRGITVEDLSNELLIDTQIGACGLTTRILAAITSTQTFIQRCLLGIEADTGLHPTAQTEWQWMSSYRLWQAQRQLFLYPEDYLHPELRDDKTPFFVQLENDLAKGELTDEAIDAAFATYLESLDSVARLQVCGIYHQVEADGAGPTIDRLHIVARSADTPAKYWYRYRDGGTQWSGWSSIGLDIAAEEVVLTVAERRLYLCWANIATSTDTDQPQPVHALPTYAVPGDGTSPAPAVPAMGNATVSPPPAHLVVSLSYSRLDDAGWSPKRIADGTVTIKPTRVTVGPVFAGTLTITEPLDPHAVRLIATPAARVNLGSRTNRPQDDAATYVYCYYPHTNNGDRPTQLGEYLRDLNRQVALAQGGFELDGCHGGFHAFPIAPDDAPRPVIKTPDNTTIASYGADGPWIAPSETTRSDVNELINVNFPPKALRASDVVSGTTRSQPLFSAGSEFALAAPNSGPGTIAYRLVLPQGGQFFFTAPFVYEDGRHSFLIEPVSPPAGSLSPVDSISATAIRQQVFGQYSATGDLKSVDKSTALAILARTNGGAPPADPSIVDIVLALPPEVVVNGIYNGVYKVTLLQHPYTCRFLTKLRSGGAQALLTRGNQQPDPDPELDFPDQYQPRPGAIGVRWYPRDLVDFRPDQPYAIYNWELFVYAPMLIAARLRNDLKFDKAQAWLHRVFNPAAAGTDATPARYWNVQPFYDIATIDPVDELREILADTDHLADPATPDLSTMVAAWRRDPFKPWHVARMRRTAIPKAIVIAYVELMIDWADSLYRKYTAETVNEAALFYTWAARVLGPAPTMLPAQPETPRSFADLRAQLDEFSNAVAATEIMLPAGAHGGATTAADTAALRALGTTFYFCVPPNRRLMSLWQTIASRMMNIRHCRNIDGQSVPLPDFGPPIDPDLLVRAAAAGVDVEAVLTSTDRGPYRFTFALAKALELCAEVRGLGAMLLGALERRDGEQLALLRSTHEQAMLSAIRDIRVSQVNDAEKALISASQGLAVAKARRDHYQRLLDSGLNVAEFVQARMLRDTILMQAATIGLEAAAASIEPLPDLTLGVAGMGGSPLATSFVAGGSKTAGGMQAASRGIQLGVGLAGTVSTLAAMLGSQARRAEDWVLQVDLATKEMAQLATNIDVAAIRGEVARAELANHDLQAAQAKAMDTALRTKFSNADLYDWHSNQMAGLYFNAYQLALEAALRAEACFAFERPERGTPSYINRGSWDSRHAGLLAGERLTRDLRRMERDFLASNTREYELTRIVSLAALQPEALIAVRTSGQCSFMLPESLFDADHPGHERRRIKSLSITLPAVVGPYTPVNATLALTASWIRVGADLLADEGGVTVIATSRGLSDTGMFELNFRDERYLPFEGRGAVNSSWTLALDPHNNDFDVQTLSDVLIELHYTAVDGTAPMNEHRSNALTAMLRGTGARLFSARSEFPDAWQDFMYPTTGADGQTLRLALSPSTFSYRAQQHGFSVSEIQIALVVSEGARTAYPAAGIAMSAKANGTAPDSTAGSLTLAGDQRVTSMQSWTVRSPATVPCEVDLVVAQTTLNNLPDALTTTAAGSPTRLRPDALADMLIIVG